MNLINKIVLIFLVLTVSKNFAQQTKRPNIIFIMTDDQSAVVPNKKDASTVQMEGQKVQSHPFGFNGDNEVHTPIIDSLAKNGMIFRRAYVSSSVCSPSRYTMMTGRYAGRSEGVVFKRLHPEGKMTRVENNTELEKDKENLPRLLQKAGYKTGFVGKNHIIDHDALVEHKKKQKATWLENGFMYYDKKSDPNNPAVDKAMKNNHNEWAKRIKSYGFDYAKAVYGANLRELFNDSLNVHNLEWKNKAALDFIDESSEEPFFLYYAETIPHGPAPWIKKKGKFVHGLDADPKYTGEGILNQDYSYLPTREEIKKEIADLDKNVSHAWLRWFDYSVGAVINKLKEKDIYENTLIVITSDHGNYNLGKTTLYESGVRVPLLMHWPNGIKPNSEYNELVQNIDFTPTFLDLAGVELEKVENTIDGISLKKVIEGDKQPVHDYLFFELGYARGVTTKDWKYIAVRYNEKAQRRIDNGVIFRGWNNTTSMLPYYTRNSHLGYHAAKLNPFYFDQDQLFDLKNDIRETKNIFKNNKGKAKTMKKLLIKKLKPFPNRPFGEMVN